MKVYRTGIGGMSGRELTTIARSARESRQDQHKLRRVASTYVEVGDRRPWVLARITGANAIGGQSNRWTYTWEEVELTTTGYSTKTGGRTSTNETSALNLCELVNDGTDTEGPGWDLATAPAGFDIQPIAQCCVQMWCHRDSTADIRWFFSMANVLDGSCT